ncbi:MAG: purine-nucleoside phosphorylase [Nocardioidaceae bacterium]|jgi:purine-nucleoside phosphorylase|nr:purine-nucleoside phosphorylase [Nocardioidaceae bacterium]
MSIHIAAQADQVAPRVLFPGDPLRAQWIADNYLEGAECYSQVRNMLGFTGTYQGERISVQGSGMGQPSMAIYANELFRDYGVQQLIRVGSCGALTETLKVRDVVLAISAATDSSMNRHRFHGFDYSATADFDLLRTAYDAVVARGGAPVVGQVFTSDSFYHPRAELTAHLVEHGVVAVEMEASALYTLAAGYGRRALALCTVSDHVVTGEETTAEEREQTFGEMVELALESMLAVPVDA